MAMIREMPASEKPREKANLYGIRTLSNRELLSLVLRSGPPGTSVLEMADELLHLAGGMKGLVRLSPDQLNSIRGIGEVKALELLASFEIARRIMLEETMNKDVVEKAGDLVQWLKLEIGQDTQEKFMVVYLDANRHILSYKVLFIGTLNKSYVFPREIFKEALLKNSPAVILVHNHPGGSMAPSDADLQLTEKIFHLAKMMDVELLDHIIVSQDDWYSFRTAGILEKMQ